MRLDFTPLLENPERYRSGDNFSGTNIIFPVSFQGQIRLYKRFPLRRKVSTIVGYLKKKICSPFFETPVLQIRSLRKEAQTLERL